MKDKKTKRIAPRVSESLKVEFETAAESNGLTASSALEQLMEAFVQANTNHPGRLVHPYELNYYPPSALNAQQQRLAANASPLYKYKNES